MSSVVTEASERLKSYFRPAMEVARRRIFGDNNERIDFLIDSFYKLTPEYQTAALAAALGSAALFLMMVFGIYFARIHTLENELNQGFQALQEVRVLGAQYKKEKANFDWVVQTVQRKTGSLRAKPFFEQMANQVGVVMEGLRSEEIPVPEDSPLAKNFVLINTEFRLPKVSIPRLLKFFSEIEKADQGMMVRDLVIRARYGDKLFFDVQARVTGYKVKGSEP